jgi:hypothetical protein
MTWFMTSPVPATARTQTLESDMRQVEHHSRAIPLNGSRYGHREGRSDRSLGRTPELSSRFQNSYAGYRTNLNAAALEVPDVERSPGDGSVVGVATWRMSELTLRVLDEEDWLIYREMRLAALEESPSVFGDTYDQEATANQTHWRSGHRMLPSRR